MSPDKDLLTLNSGNQLPKDLVKSVRGEKNLVEACTHLIFSHESIPNIVKGGGGCSDKWKEPLDGPADCRRSRPFSSM